MNQIGFQLSNFKPQGEKCNQVGERLNLARDADGHDAGHAQRPNSFESFPVAGDDEDFVSGGDRGSNLPFEVV